MRRSRKALRLEMRALRRETKVLQQEMDEQEQRTAANHIEIMSILEEIRGQLGQILNEYLY